MNRLHAIASVFAVLGLANCSGGSAFTSSNASGAATGGSSGGASAGGVASTAGGNLSTGGGVSSGGQLGTGGADPNAGGYGTMTCDQLKAAYLAELATAKSCTPNTATNVCTAYANATIPCGCQTYINNTRTAAAANMRNILAQYTNDSCPPCTNPLTCNAAASASCVAAGTAATTGKCTDAPITTTGVGTSTTTGTAN